MEVNRGASVHVEQLWKVFGLSRDAEIDLLPQLRSGHIPHAAQNKHPAAVFAVAGVEFQIAPGEIFCIMGLSGSGKSTLVRLINRLIEPTLGSIKIDGVEITALDASALRQQRSAHIAMVFQNVSLFPHRTVVENVAYALEVRNVPRRERLKVAENLLQLVQLSDWGHHMPVQLSGGMQQRVGIARALAASPKLLLMDEPFSALDPLIRRELQDEFLDIVRRTGVTTIFITHDFDEAVYLGDRIAIMRDGQFEQLGAPREIVFSPANDYVARFISAEAVIGACQADDIMRSVAPGDRLENVPRCPRSLPVPQLLTLFGDGVELVQVVDGERTVGVITRSGVTERLGAVLTRHKNATQSLQRLEGHMPLVAR